MLSKARIKFIKSLQIKKYRLQEQSFVVEGEKSVIELLSSGFQIEVLYCTQEFQERNPESLKRFTGEVVTVKPTALTNLGSFETNDAALAVARLKDNEKVEVTENEFGLVLDDIRDPGNLGTIIRTADWYGIHKIIASPLTVDYYNPKAIHASMGSFTRAQIYYTDLVEFLATVKVPVMGTFLTGENLHQVTWGAGGLIVIGNEAHGISKPVEELISRRITIPKFGKAESLNAAVATAVICDNIRRKKF